MKRHLAPLAILLLSAAPQAGRAAQTVDQIITHHIASAGSGDVDAVMSDYAENATVISPGGSTTGKDAIRAMFAKMLGDKSRAPLVLDKRIVAGDVGYIAWSQGAGKPGEVRGSDTFVTHDGKITVQTVMAVPLTGAGK